MGRLRGWLRRLERDSQDEEIIIAQADGTFTRFPDTAEAEAFGHEARRMDAIYRCEDPGEAHPLTVAKRNARHPELFGIIFDADRQPRYTTEDEGEDQGGLGNDV
jgi:hypothetical protein